MEKKLPVEALLRAIRQHCRRHHFKGGASFNWSASTRIHMDAAPGACAPPPLTPRKPPLRFKRRTGTLDTLEDCFNINAPPPPTDPPSGSVIGGDEQWPKRQHIIPPAHRRQPSPL